MCSILLLPLFPSLLLTLLEESDFKNMFSIMNRIHEKTAWNCLLKWSQISKNEVKIIHICVIFGRQWDRLPALDSLSHCPNPRVYWPTREWTPRCVKRKTF